MPVTFGRGARAVATVVTLAALGGAGASSYVVRPNETLSEVAVKTGSSVSAIAQANGIRDVNRVTAGTRLAIPSASPSTSSSPSSASRTATSRAPARQGRTYVVQPGDSLDRIAARHSTTVSALVAANNLRNADVVVIGTRLTIPAPGAASAKSAKSPKPAAAAKPASTAKPASASAKPVPAKKPVAAKLAVATRTVADTPRLKPIAAIQPVSSRYPAALQASPERLALVPIFRRWAGVYSVPADLLMAMAWMESGWQNSKRSYTGAKGIGQLMPDTVDFVSDRLIGTPLDPNDPNDNIRMSARFLRYLLDENGGNVERALASYYQGLRALRERGMYDDTKFYVKTVLALRSRFR